MHLQEFIALKLSKEEGNAEMITYYQSFHQRHIFIKMAKPLLMLLSMADSNQPHMYKLRFMILIVYDHIRMYMLELNDEDFVPPVPEL